MTAILVARALGDRSDDVVTLAVLLEFLHTATLLHDDVVDHSNVAVGAKLSTFCGEMRQVCSWVISSIPGRSSLWCSLSEWTSCR